MVNKSLILLLLLTACSKPDIIYTPEKVDVAIAVKCQAISVKPPIWLTATIPANAAYIDKVKAMAQDLDSAKGYISELKAALKSCS